MIVVSTDLISGKTLAGSVSQNINIMREFQAETAEVVTQLANASVIDKLTIRELIETNVHVSTSLGVANA